MPAKLAATAAKCEIPMFQRQIHAFHKTCFVGSIPNVIID